MSDEYRGKTFKSGNSVAVRLPKAFGIPDGADVRVVKESASAFRIERVEPPKRGIDVDSFWGKLPADFEMPPREDFEERPRVWDGDDWPFKGDSE